MLDLLAFFVALGPRCATGLASPVRPAPTQRDVHLCSCAPSILFTLGVLLLHACWSCACCCCIAVVLSLLLIVVDAFDHFDEVRRGERALGERVPARAAGAPPPPCSPFCWVTHPKGR